MMNIIPLENRAVIKPLEEKSNAHGIIIPSDAKEKSMEGTVMAVGDGLVTYEGNEIKMKLKVGDIVLYSKFVGTEIMYQEEEYLIMKESEVLAILKEV
ncbi:MAG: co-chaperone GroES [Chloroflexota bacterium]|nr:co-chaperone GroES [Chloroflexota bacterium]